MQKMRPYYGLSDPKSNLVLENMTHNFDGGVTIRFTQMLFNVPVYNASLTFELDKEGVIHTVHGTIYPQLERTLYNQPIYPVVTPNQAAQIATRSLAYPSTLTSPVVKPYYLYTRGNTQRIYEVSFGESGRVWVHAVLGHIVPIEQSQQSTS
jgi:Zn-dependent metalloprotease